MNRVAVLFLVGASLPIGAANYWADSYNGNDAAIGSNAKPFQTLTRCIMAMRNSDTCTLKYGVYYTEDLQTSISGIPGRPVVLQSDPAGMMASIRQGFPLNWIQSGSIWFASFDRSSVLRSQIANPKVFERGIRLWRNDTVIQEATFPGVDINGFPKYLVAEAGSNAQQLVSSTLPGGSFDGGYALALGGWHEGIDSRPILGSTWNSVIVPPTTAPGVQYQLGAGTQFFLRGTRNLINGPWQWGWDQANQRIWLVTDGSNPNLANVRVQTTSSAFYLNGASYWNIHDVRFDGATPQPVGTTHHIRYSRVIVREPGLVRWKDTPYDYAQKSGLLLPDNSRLTLSQFDGCDVRCVHAVGTTDTIDNSTFRNSNRMGQYDGAIALSGPNALVLRNYISYTGRDGIAFMSYFVGKGIVRRNRIERFGLQASDAAGVVMGTHDDVVLVDSNLVQYGTNATGVMFDQDASFNQVFHNVFTDVRSAVVFKAGKDLPGVLRNNQVNNNTVYRTGALADFREVRSLVKSELYNNTWSAVVASPYYSYPLTSTKATSPPYMALGLGFASNYPESMGLKLVYQDPAGLNFTMVPGSWPIDKGGLYTPRFPFSGDAPDLGAVESGTTPWMFGPYQDPSPASLAVLGFEDVSLWHPLWGSTVYTTLSSDHIQGSSSLSVNSGGYAPIESAQLDQNTVNASSLFQISYKMVIPPAWPGAWMGDMQIYFDCPSQGIWNQPVTTVPISFTNKPTGVWTTETVIIPARLSNMLAGKVFRDFKIRIGLSLPSPPTPILLDGIQFIQ